MAVSTYLVHNAKIFTADPATPFANALMVENQHISWVGNKEQLDNTPRQQIDAEGALIIPGLIDAHMHPLMFAEMNQQIAALPPRINSIADLQHAIKVQRVNPQFNPERDWILGWGYDESKFDEGRSPTRWDLDEACPDAPVSIVRACAHVRCVNSKALELAGITRNTKDPEGGVIERDTNGEPTGILRENARDLVSGIITSADENTRINWLLELGETLSSQGIVALADMGSLDTTDNLPLLRKAAQQGFKQRVASYYMWDHWMNNPNFTLTNEDLDCTQQIFVAGLKLIGDGSISGKTAWMDKPYRDKDGKPRSDAEAYGMPVCSDKELESALAFCKQHHCQLAIHAMGERAIKRALDFTASERPWVGNSRPSLRLEHVTLPSAESIRTMAARGIAVASQPIFPFAEIEAYLAALGEETTKRCYPYKTMQEAGVLLCFSSDAPATAWATPSDPFPALQAAITRKAYDGTDIGANEGIDLPSALLCYTRFAAEVLGLDDLGSLTPGKRASFVILQDNLFEMAPSTLANAKVQATYIDGNCVYSA